MNEISKLINKYFILRRIYIYIFFSVVEVERSRLAFENTFILMRNVYFFLQIFDISMSYAQK